MSREFEIGIVTRAEKAEGRLAELESELADTRAEKAAAEVDRDRYLGERNQLLNHLAEKIDAA